MEGGSATIDTPSNAVKLDRRARVEEQENRRTGEQENRRTGEQESGRAGEQESRRGEG
jgi:hypothetical protein